VNPPCNRKGKSGNPPPKVNASEFYPNQNAHGRGFEFPWAWGPTHGYESSVLAPADSKRVIRDFRGSETGLVSSVS